MICYRQVTSAISFPLSLVMSRHFVCVLVTQSRKFILQTTVMCYYDKMGEEREREPCAVVATTFSSEHITLMKNSETQKAVERGVFQFLLDFYLNFLKQLVIYSVNVCVYMLSKVIMSNDVGFSVNHITNKNSHDVSCQKVKNSSNNWVSK